MLNSNRFGGRPFPPLRRGTRTVCTRLPQLFLWVSPFSKAEPADVDHHLFDRDWFDGL